MTSCLFSLIVIAFVGLIALVFRKPSDKEIKKFKDKSQDKINWSKMGF